MKPQPAPTKPAAAMAASLLFATLTSVALAQATTPVAPPATNQTNDEPITLETMTVSTGYRVPKAIDQIPGPSR